MLGVTASSCKIVNGSCIEWKKSNFPCCQRTSPQDIIMHSPLHSSIILLLAASSGDSYSRCWCMRCSNTNIWWQRNEENVSRKSIKHNRVLVRGCSDIFCPRCERWEQKVDHHQRWSWDAQLEVESVKKVKTIEYSSHSMQMVMMSECWSVWLIFHVDFINIYTSHDDSCWRGFEFNVSWELLHNWSASVWPGCDYLAKKTFT